MTTQKAAEPRAAQARVNGHYQPAPSPVRLLLFDPKDADNEQYRGLKIYVRTKIPMSVYFLAAEPVNTGDPEYWEKVRRRHADFGHTALVAWNLSYPEGHELAGEPIPCTGEEYMNLDLDLGVAIRNAWFYTVRTPGDVADPLDYASPSNATEQ